MKILVACEFSGIVRDAFADRGHHTVSVDILNTEKHAIPPAYHRVSDAILTAYHHGPWDMMIAFPPCIDIAVSGARWFKDKDQTGAKEFFFKLVNAPISKIAIENPVGVMSTVYRKPDQIIQPWMFGHGETKGTCLWLKNLPKLIPTKMVSGRLSRVHREPPSPDRWKNRSRTYQGIADAMAEQWGGLS